MPKSAHFHLKSDDDSSIFISNSPSDFSNKLPKSIHCEEPSFLALKGIQYCNSFENYNSKKDRITLFDFNYIWPPRSKRNPGDVVRYGIYYNITLRSGYYYDPIMFITRLNSKIRAARIKRLKGKELFTYDEASQKFNIAIDLLNLALIIKGNAITLLGLTSLHKNIDSDYVVIGKTKKLNFYIDNGKKKFYLQTDWKRWTSNSTHGGIAPFPAEMNSNAIFNVYLDCIESCIYGSGYSKLLKMLNSKVVGHVGQRVYQEFPDPIFLPLASQTLDVITVQIRNQYGSLVKFLQGPVILFLQLKPARYVV